MLNGNTGFGIEQIETIAWATPAGISLDDLIEKMASLGNTVLEIDRSGNRIKLLHIIDKKEEVQSSLA